MTTILDENNLGSIGKFIQRATTKSFFMKIFQFQPLLGQNRSSIEVHQFGLGSSVH